MSGEGGCHSSCAACGRGGDNLKECTSCREVKYCNRTCQASHWRHHKKQCRRRAAEMFDDALFKQPPPREECVICMLPFPLEEDKWAYQPCCGNTLCQGCIRAVIGDRGVAPCPFCRIPAASSEAEVVARYMQRMEVNDPDACEDLGNLYAGGTFGMPQDLKKSFELYSRGVELGSIRCHYKVANAYRDGIGVGKDMEKSIHHSQIAAMAGHVAARHNLGVSEVERGNTMRGLKHIVISAMAGEDKSLRAVGAAYRKGNISKGKYEKVLRAHKCATDATKSDQRDRAADILDGKCSKAARVRNFIGPQ